MMNCELIDNLLDEPLPMRQAALLRGVEMLNAGGLTNMLEVASDLVRSDPGRARRLAVICGDLAGCAGAPLLVPQATYIRAQTHAINADFATALTLIDTARAGYEVLGAEMDALRTNGGRMHVLKELGRYQEALETGRYVLGRLNSSAKSEAPVAAEANLIAALVHQNSGLCYEHMGRYEEALAAYDAAEAQFQMLHMRERIGDISNNRGIILMQLGRAGEALAAFRAAASVFAESDFTVSHAQALINMGDAHVLLGNYSLGLASLEQASRLLGPLDTLAEKQVLLLDLADTYLALNLYPEALAAYEDALDLLQDAGMAHDQARALWGMGSAFAALDRLGDAQQCLTEAGHRFIAAENVPLLSGVLVEHAALMAVASDRNAALALARRAFGLVAGGDWPVQLLYAHLRLADLAFPAAQAEPHLLNAQSLAHTLELPHLRYRVNQRLGHLRLSQGRFDEAQAFLELAITDIERLRGSLTHELVRSSFLRDKVAAYEDLVFLYLTRGGEDDMLNAFEVAERAKSRALVEAISTGDQLNPAPDTASTLQPQIVAAQTQLNAIYNEMLGNAGGRDGNTLLASLHSRAQELEQEISRLRLRGVASTTEPRTSPLVSVDADRCELPPDMMMIAFHILGDEIMAFVRKDGRLHAIRKISSVSVAQRLVQDLAVQWDRFRAGPEFTGRHMQMLERSAQRVLGELYRELLLPIFSRCPGTAEGTQLAAPQRLVIIPHGLLHQVPFHALFDGQRYVLDQFEISYAPSATVLALCQQRPIRPGNKAVVLGVEDPLLPAVTSEVRAVAGQFAEVTVLLGEQATVAELQAVAHDCDVIHLACHGLFRVDNPLFSALKLHDQWLLAADIMQWQLSGALVTLSACESGRSQVLAGDEVIGLTRAVLGAGAATLVVSLWLVQDETTAALMSMWYEQARQIGRAAALRNAQLELKAKYPHPYYWAPFVLVGQP